MSDDNLQKASHLSNICDELRSTAEQRDQELQDISHLLEGIRQLQADQRGDNGVAAIRTEQRPEWQKAAATAVDRHLQETTVQAHGAGTFQMAAMAADAHYDIWPACRGSADAAAPEAPAHGQGQAGPQVALLKLLQQANSSGSTEGNAMCGGSSRGGSPNSSPTSHVTPTRNEANSRQHDPHGQALSKFSFPGAGTASVHKYITPLKIPHPVRNTSARCSNIDSDSGDSSSVDSGSSGHGSYVSHFFKGAARQRSAAGNHLLSPASVGSSRADNHVPQSDQHSSRPSPVSSPAMDISPAAREFKGPAAAAGALNGSAWQLSTSNSPRRTPASSMSSEAAALMLALQAAAHQREAAREVLQARSSLASSALTRNTPTPRAGSPGDWGCQSGEEARQPDKQQQQVFLGAAAADWAHSEKLTIEATSAKIAAKAASRSIKDNNRHPNLRDTAKQLQQKHHKRQIPRSKGSTPCSSPKCHPSVLGPGGLCSSRSSVCRKQQAAVDQLMQEAIESSSMSSLMGLLESQDSEDDDCAAIARPVEGAGDGTAAAAAAQPTIMLPPMTEVSVAHTWGSSSGSTPVRHCARGAGGDDCPAGSPAGAEQASWGQAPGAAQPHQDDKAQLHQQEQEAGQCMRVEQMPQAEDCPSSAVSSGATQLHFDALNAELEFLSNQVEQERRQLQDLQQQKHQVKHGIHAEAHLASGPSADEIPHKQHLQQFTSRQVDSAVTLQQGALRLSRSCSFLPAAAKQAKMDQPAVLLTLQQSKPARNVSAAAAAAVGVTAEPHQTSVPGNTVKVSAANAAVVSVSDVCLQAGSGAVENTAGAPGTDAACQALLLHVSGLPVAGPPAACRVCPAAQQQLTELQQKLGQAQEQLKQAQLSAETSHHQAMTAEAQLALSRQKLRGVLSANAKPLAMSGWEDLIEEAAADLDRIEGHVAAAAARLIELQASSTSAAEALIASQREADRQQAAAATAALKTEELQQQAEGLVAAISSNECFKDASSQQMKALQEQLQQQQQAAAAAIQQLTGLQEQLQQVQQHVANADRELDEKERSKQQLLAETSDKQHQLQVLRGDCASAQDRLSQLQTSLVEARQQLEDLQQQHRQQQRQCEDTGKHLAVLQTQRTAAAAEAAGAQQELSRVLKELEQCQRDVQSAELQHAELEEAAAEKQCQHDQHSQAATAAAKQRQELEADVAAAQEQLKQLQQQAQAAQYEADLCTRAAAAADRQLLQMQQTLAALQTGAAVGSRSAAAADASSAAAAAAATATAHLAECAQLQVKLAAAESRRQLAEEKAEESDRRLQQLKQEISSLRSQHDTSDRQLRQVTSKCERLKDKLREKCDSLSDVQGKLQQAQLQLHSLTESATAAVGRSNQAQQQQQAFTTPSPAAAVATAEGQQLQSQQQRLQDLGTELDATRSKLQQAEQQLQQQRDVNSNLQQQLSLTQQQLVQAQQHLLEADPKQLGPEPASQQQQADQVQMAVRSSIQGLYDALELQSKLQHAQLQAETAKQQLQEMQQDKKQLQKKLAAYKQQVLDLKALYDSQCLQVQQRADQQGAQAAASDAAAALVSEAQQQLKLLQAELVAARGQLGQSELQLQWAGRETDHLKQLLQQQQEISSQLKGEVQRLQHQAAANSQQDMPQLEEHDAALVTASAKGHTDHGMATAAAAELQQIQADLAMSKQQLLQAHAESAAAKHELAALQQQLASAELLQQQQAQQQLEAKLQMQQKEAELSHTTQQLVQQQQQHKWQEVQWEQKLQAAIQQTGQDLLECRAELDGTQATLKQLQDAAVVLEQQLVAAVKAADHYTLESTSADGACSQGTDHAAPVVAGSSSNGHAATSLAQAVQLVKQLSGTCLSALAAKQQLQQEQVQAKQQMQQQLQRQADVHSSHLQQLMKAVEAGELRRQEAELQQWKLQQECQLLHLQLQKHPCDQQVQLPGHMQSMSSVVDIMNKLHTATQQSLSSAAAAWGTSSCGVLRASAAGPAAAVASATPAETARTTPMSTPHMSVEALGGLTSPANCLSPEVPDATVTAATGGICGRMCAAANGHHGALKPAAARGLQFSCPSATAAAGSHTVAGPGCDRPDSEMAVLRQRLMRLSQDMMMQLQNTGHSLPQQQQCQQSPQQQVQQQQYTEPAAASVSEAHQNSHTGTAFPRVVLADAELQKSWEWLQEQAAAHDTLMQHMKQMWTQAAALAEHCMDLQAAAAATAAQNSAVQAVNQQPEQQQNPRSSLSSAADAAGVYLSSSGLAVVEGLLTTVQPLLSVARQLQLDIVDLSSHNKQVIEAAKKLCSSFRSGGRAVRVRALALKIELQQHCAQVPNIRDQESTVAREQQSLHGQAASGDATAGDILPAEVAHAVVQHWNEVENLLAQLHQSCEALLQPRGAARQQCSSHQQRHVRHSNSSSRSPSRQPALRGCRKLLDGLQQLVEICQQHQRGRQLHCHQQPEKLGMPALRKPATAMPSHPQQLSLSNNGNSLHGHDGSRPVEYQQLGLSSAHHSSTSSSTCSSERLGTLLAVLKSQVVTAGIDVGLSKGDDTVDAERWITNNTKPPKQKQAAGLPLASTVTAETKPPPGPQVSRVGSRAAAVGFSSPVKQCSSSKKSQTKPKQQSGSHSAKLSISPTAGSVTSSAAELKPTGGQADCWAGAAVARSASIRRAERSVLMQKLRLLQQQ